MSTADAASVWRRLCHELEGVGLHVVRAVSQASLDRAGVDVTLATWLPGARAAVVVGDGGQGFFAGFERDGDRSVPNPLDGYTERVVRAAVARALAGSATASRVLHPFRADPGTGFLPFQRIGVAAGLPPPGPLALQIHPVHGPWWAYRALVVLDVALDEEVPLASPCVGCPAPCQDACPGGAVTTASSFRVDACVTERLAGAACRSACAARLACVVGQPSRHAERQHAFHMGASFAMLRRR